MTQAPPPSAAPAAPSPAPTSERSFGVASLLFTLLGAVVVAVGILGVRWTTSTGDDSDNLSEPKFLLLRKLILALDGVQRSEAPWTVAYFSWVALVLIVATFVLALVAAYPIPAPSLFRVLGFVVGLLSAAATLFMPALDGIDGLSRYLSGGFGLFFVVAGSLLMAIGAIAGGRRKA